MTSTAIALTVALLTHAADDGALPKASVRMQAAPLGVGEPLEFVVRFDHAPAAWWGDPGNLGFMRPILQVDAPECVKLLGAPPSELVTPLDFETNDLRFPFGRKVFEEETRVAFELLRAPEAGERIELNLIYWLDNDMPEKARFFRRRLELELAPDAQATPGDAKKTSWGEQETLNVGDKTNFVLTSHDGYEVELAEYLGSSVLIATYRAYW